MSGFVQRATSGTDNVSTSRMLDQVMDALDLEVEPFALCEIGTGSDLAISDLGWVTVHYVLAGEGEVRVGHRPPLPVTRYSLVLIRRAHELHGTAGGEPFSISFTGVDRLTGTPPGPATFVVACGRIQATYGRTVGLFEESEDPLVLDFEGSEDMRRIFDAILHESQDPGDGSLSMLRALTRQCLIQVLRELSDQGGTGIAWVDALGDARMGPVVKEIMDRPEAPHTVASLSEVANMSRSAFAARFKDCFHETPMGFVRAVRLRKASNLLRTTQLTTDLIGRRSGFGSRSAFVDAFKREFGVSPGRFRRAALES